MTRKQTDKSNLDPTGRALWVLLHDMQELVESTNRVKVQVQSLATRHGVPLPRPLSP
jgi:hypothetical protein